ncbi:heterokaryon incompatibility protein-domain-containing protein [Xylaria scruposa]|nr:heterokaryon incompatibility protein-domain-containing protein [Xylaria scruposa]
MLRWHPEDCPGCVPKFRGEFVDCFVCLSSSSHLLDPPRRSRGVPVPSVKRRSCLNLAWPSSVEYSEKCIAKPGGQDLSRALVNYLGNAPYKERPNAQQDEKSKLGFPALSSSHHVRVLHLSPAKQWAKPLHGYLEVQDLNGRPHYEALSYTWIDENGDTMLSERLYIGTEWDVLPITKSCSRALRRLRLEYADRPIWVDSICINQLNNVEKSHQIALMKIIYARSIRCVVDLGEHSSSSDMAIEYINNPDDDKSMDESSQQNKDDAISDLFRRKYFSRIWIIQEIVSAPLVKVNCGARSVDLRLLVASTPILSTLKWMQGFRDGIAAGRPTSAYNGPKGLLQLLRDTVDSKCSDPRDKIFALLGLVRGLDPEGITADYDLTYVQVYTGLAAYFIRNCGLTELVILPTQKDLNLPSWVPNWTAIQECDWTDLDKRSSGASIKTLAKTASPILDNSLRLILNGYYFVRLRSIVQDTDLVSEKLYRPEIHGHTGALILEGSCIFSFQDPQARKSSSTRYTKLFWKASECNVSQLIIVTPEPVNENTDIIALFRGQKFYVHLRRNLAFTYRILGEAMVFLHEITKGQIRPFPPETIPAIKRHALFSDYITLWCEKVSNASQLWEIFKDPTGSGGLQARFAWERQTSCIFYYRVVTVEEAYGQYVSLKEEIGSLEGVLRRWITDDGPSPMPIAVRELIECILYWREPHRWEISNISYISLLSVSRAIVEPHLTACVNANLLWQRWLAIEKLLAERHETDKTCGARQPIFADSLFIVNEPMKKIIETWKDITGNLVLRLNLLADVADLNTLPTWCEMDVKTNEPDQECNEFLKDIFTGISQELGEICRSCKPHSTFKDNEQFSSSAESPGTPYQAIDLLGLPSDEGCYALTGFHHRDWQENTNDMQSDIDIDSRIRYDAVQWEEHWKIPRSRNNIKAAVEAFGITKYGDRRRFALWKEPDIEARRAAQVSGELLNLSIQALKHEDMVII